MHEDDDPTLVDIRFSHDVLREEPGYLDVGTMEDQTFPSIMKSFGVTALFTGALYVLWVAFLS